MKIELNKIQNHILCPTTYVFSSFYLRSKFLDQLCGVLSTNYSVCFDSVQTTQQTPGTVFSNGGTPTNGCKQTVAS
jgi:hypothetical protein